MLIIAANMYYTYAPGTRLALHTMSLYTEKVRCILVPTNKGSR